MKKALIFDPYLNILGGGERYSLTFALALTKNNYSVEIAWPNPNTLNLAEDRFGLDLTILRVNPLAYQIFTSQTSLFKKYLFTKQYDLIFWISDGSLPLLFSKNNLVHFQVPFLSIGGSWLLNRFKSLLVSKYVYNSEFTREINQKQLGDKEGYVLYPPINTDNLVVGKKQNQILYVGRFSSKMTEKRQDLLIESFKKFSKKTTGYKLVLAGGVVGDQSVINTLKKQAKGLNIEIIPNPNYSVLKDLYAKSKFFWQTAGLGIDESKNPEKVEHFGMTTVEAMASGCIALAINKGGLKEIITPGTGFLCNDENDLVAQTLAVSTNSVLQQQLSKQAVKRSQEFSNAKFYEKINLLLQ